MKVSRPLTWGIIGALVGFFAGLAGQDNRVLDGLAGAAIQSIIWFSLAWVVIKIKKRKPSKVVEQEIAQNDIEAKSSGVKLKIIFLIVYSFLVVLPLATQWAWSGNYEISQLSSIDKISNLSSYVFSFVGMIDIFISPALAYAITITSAVFFYRKSVVKLKNKKNRIALKALVCFSALLIYMVITFLLVIVKK